MNLQTNGAVNTVRKTTNTDDGVLTTPSPVAIGASQTRLLAALVQLIRPTMLVRTFALMLFAGYAAVGREVIQNADFWRAAGAVTIMWAGLYTLNDVMDQSEDAADHVKADRPLVTGAISANQAWLVALGLIAAGLLWSWSQSMVLGVLTLLMIISQISYSGPLFRVKYRPLGDLALIGVANPVLRFAAGSLLAGTVAKMPLLGVITITMFHLTGVLVRDILFWNGGQTSRAQTIRFLGPTASRSLARATMGIGIIAFMLLCLNSQSILRETFLGFLPLKFLFLLPSVVAFGVFAIRIAGNANMFDQQRIRIMGQGLLIFTTALSITLLLIPD